MEQFEDCALLKRSRSFSEKAEVHAGRVLSYRPKPSFEGSQTSSSSYFWPNFACSTSVVACGSKGSPSLSSPPFKASGQSTMSSPLLSTVGKSSNSSSPSVTWSSPRISGSPFSSCSNGGNPDPTDAARCSKKALGQATVEEPHVLAIDRAASWSQLLGSAEEGHGETPEKKHAIDMSELFLGQKFACGTYSRLYRGRFKQQEVAVKLVRQPDDDEEIANRLDRQFGQEVSLLSRLHHKNIVQFVGAVRKPPVFCIITEYLGGGSLRAFLHKYQPDVLPVDTVLAFALDIARGMEYLHSQGVLHLDLKSHNLVLADDWCIKVTDFGVARLQSECESMTPDCGTYRWMSPEMISNKTFSTKADVYSFGIILWEILTGQNPYEDMSTIQAAFAVVHKNARPHIPNHCPHPLKKLMEECWAALPEKRPSFWQIVQSLEQYQDCLHRNVSFRFGESDSGKRTWVWPLLQKFRRKCSVCTTSKSLEV